MNQSGHSFWREGRKIWRGHKSLTRGVKYISMYYIFKVRCFILLSSVSCLQILNPRKNYLGYLPSMSMCLPLNNFQKATMLNLIFGGD